jgi:tetratricopeptide (TPR) repeat protein
MDLTNLNKKVIIINAIIILSIIILLTGCQSKEEIMQNLFDSAKEKIEVSEYTTVFSSYSRLRDKYKNEQLSTDLYNLIIQRIEMDTKPLLAEKKYDDVIAELQKKASEFEPISVYCYGLVGEIMKLRDSEIAYQSAINSYNEKKYLDAFLAYKRVLSESEYYEEAQNKMLELSKKLYPQYLSEAKEYFSKKDYSKAVENINIAVTLKPDDESASMLQLSYKKTKVEFDDKQSAIAEAKAIKENMSTYEFGTGNIGIGCHVKSSRIFNGGYNTYTAAKDYVFLWVDVGAYNNGNSTEHVNPNDFTLSTPDGFTVNPDTDTTYSLNNYFDAIDLPPNGKSQGWLIFHVPKSSKYYLNYMGFNSSVKKTLTAE